MLASLDRPKTLKDGALKSLREAITLGYLKPGERLIERVLCDRLGVSRTVVRECIRHLEGEWLVTSVPNVGPSVATIDSKEVSEIYEIRALLERNAIKSCALLATTQTVRQLREHCSAIAESLANNEIVNALQQTTDFYHTIFVTGNKDVSWELVKRLNGRISRLRAMTLASPGRAAAGPRSLRRIVTAIKQQDPEKAASACKNHILEASRIAQRELAAQGPV